MSKKKKKVTKSDSAAPAEKVGEKVEVEPAHVEEATIMVRGTAMGGTQMMTPTEHKAYCAEQKKKVAK
jgi:hypothetical protein